MIHPKFASLGGMKRLVKSEDGGTTAFGIFICAVVIGFGGLAIDVTNVIQERTRLQIAGDAAAHAALVARESKTEAEAKALALDVAAAILPNGAFGDALNVNDIQFGQYNSATKGFTVDPGANDAVLVSTQRLAERSNSVGAMFLQFVGHASFDIRTRSVFETYMPTCLREGFVAEDVVDVSTSNEYQAGFCIHSNTHIDAQNDNYYHDGVIVSMPDMRDAVMPTAGWTSNIGLPQALRDGAYQLRIINRITDIIAGVQDPTSTYYRDYITDPTPLTFSNSVKVDDVWQPGRIHVFTCSNPKKKLNINTNATIDSGVIVTNCIFSMPQGVTMTNVMIASENEENPAIDMASGFTLGDDDNCSPGGGSQIVTLGGVKLAADVSFYGSQILAAQEIQFTSNALGIEGVSLVSGEGIIGTSNSNIGFCGGAGLEDNFEAWYFRMAG